MDLVNQRQWGGAQQFGAHSNLRLPQSIVSFDSDAGNDLSNVSLAKQLCYQNSA